MSDHIDGPRQISDPSADLTAAPNASNFETTLAYSRSGPTRTNCLPKFAPLRRPMNAPGALSSPSVTNSLYFTLPSRTHCDMSRKKSA
jgi:hypothetical protein